MAWESGWEEREVVLEELGGRGTDRQTREWSGGWEGEGGRGGVDVWWFGERMRRRREGGVVWEGGSQAQENLPYRNCLWINLLKDYRFRFLSWVIAKEYF